MLLSALLATVLAAPLAQTVPGRQALTIPRVTTPPRLEDYLSGERRDGVSADAFLQREPQDLTPATERTEVYVSYDDTSLYAVFVCHATDPSRIRARMSRREQIFNDDFVGLFLDTFNDRQRAYEFLASPLGIQLDGILTEGTGDDFSFDTIWQTRGRLTPFGYVVWMSIPFKSLRFPSAAEGEPTWGVAFMRGIPVKSENVFWPGQTRRISSFTNQFADLHGLQGVTAGRNIQLIPYGTFTGARFLDRNAAKYDSQNDGRAGVDAKIVAKDSLAFDFTLNPDFSQVESDEPQVTINQRFEVFFPEKRPFFLENSAYFQTPVTLFFSRRIRDPQLGARMTGKIGRWAVGAIALDDRAAGRAVSDTEQIGGQRLRDATYSANVGRDSRQFSYQLDYTDIGKDFVTTLGFIPRTDIRQATQFVTYRWRPKTGALLSYGPNSFVQATWDHTGQLQDWSVRFPFEMNFKSQTGVFVRRTEGMERFSGIEFREHENLFSFFTSYLRWMDVGIFALTSTRPNFFPAQGLTPFIANARDAQLSLTFRPASGLLLDETYIYSHLDSGQALGPTRTIFDNHIVRSRANYQFTREFSLRAIVDYNAVLSDSSLVALDRTKHLSADILLTYLVHPGTALYIGYTDGYDSIAIGPSGLRPSRNPTTSTGRQFFVKTSYLFRF